MIVFVLALTSVITIGQRIAHVYRITRDLEGEFRADFSQAADDSARRRVIIDQVASLTDVSAHAWALRLLN